MPTVESSASACRGVRPAMSRSGAISASGTSTKARSNSLGCGSVSRSVDAEVVVGEQVEIERARPPAPLMGAVAAERPLDPVQGEQQRVRIEVGVDRDAGVDEARLLLVAPRRRGVVGGAGEQRGLRHAADPDDGLFERRADVADIAAERNQDLGHRSAAGARDDDADVVEDRGDRGVRLGTVTFTALTRTNAARIASAHRAGGALSR